jgi:hypothetical protein
VSGAGEVTLPLQPAGQFYKNGDSDVVSTSFVIVNGWAAEWQVGSNFHAANGIFTAPVDGVYLFNWQINVELVDTDVPYFIWVVEHTGGNNTVWNVDHCQQDETDYSYHNWNLGIAIQLDASDTIWLQWKVPSGTMTAKINGTYSNFSFVQVS